MPLATATNPFAFFPKRGLLFAPISPVIVLAIWCQQASGQAAAFEDAVRPLIENHCITCHGPEVQKAKLRLDDLQPDLRDERIMATWATVYDKLVTGEMPPKNRERPAQDELQAATMWLKKELHAASLEQQQKTGRVLIRRLNGTEYENTMRDLLGTQRQSEGHATRRRHGSGLRQHRRRARRVGNAPALVPGPGRQGDCGCHPDPSAHPVQ